MRKEKFVILHFTLLIAPDPLCQLLIATKGVWLKNTGKWEVEGYAMRMNKLSTKWYTREFER